MVARKFTVVKRRARGHFGIDGGKKRDEDTIQESVVGWIEQCAPDCLVWHVPNGMPSNPITGARMKKIGLRAGVADLTVLAPGGTTLLIEVKTDDGKLSPEQKAFGNRANDLGHFFQVVRSIEDVRRAFTRAGVHTREAAI